MLFILLDSPLDKSDTMMVIYECILNFRNHLKILLHLWISCAFVLHTFTQYGSIAIWNRYTYFFANSTPKMVGVAFRNCCCSSFDVCLFFLFSSLMVEPAHFFIATHHKLNPQLVTVLIIVRCFVWKMIR